jgi:hypothetical protein
LETRERNLQESGANCIMKSFTIGTLTKYYLHNTTEDEMGGERCMWQIENTFKIMVRETEQKRPDRR